MSYVILPEESFSVAVRRIALEQVAEALASINTKDQRENGIHDARKNFKRLRALYRLFRDEIGEKEYHRHNIYYREIGRTLSRLRDAASILEALEQLEERFSEYVKADTFLGLQKHLNREKASLYKRELQVENPVEKVNTQLAKAEEMIDHPEIGDYPWKNVARSLKRVYRRGYKRFRESLDLPSEEQIHEWRKRVKYLMYQHELLEYVWPPVIQEFIGELQNLSDLLGHHRDLALLKKSIEESAGHLDQHLLEVISGLATRRQWALLERAQQLGAKIYAEKPAHFKRRFSAYLLSWKAERSAT